MSNAPDSPDAPTPPRSTGDRILRAGAVVLLAHIALKVVSLVQFRMIGRFCDPVTRDLFVFAFEGVLLTLFFIGEEAIGPAFLPIFMEEKDKKGEDSAWRFANTILTVQTIILLAVITLVALLPTAVVHLLTAWEREGANPLYMASAPLYVRYMILGLLGLSLGSTTYMLLNSYKRFFLAAFGDASVKIGVVVALAVAYVLHIEMSGWEAAVVFILGTLVGSVLKLATHLWGLRDKLRLLRFTLHIDRDTLKRFLLLMAPLLVGILFAKFRDIFNNIYVLSHVSEGLLSLSAFGRKLYQTIGYLVPYAVSIAMLPFFCEMVDRNEKEKLGELVTQSGKLIFLMCAPLAAGVVALSLPLAQVLYQVGKFDYHGCELVAVSNACFSLVLPFYALEYVMMQAFFSNRKMISITVVGILCSLLSMAIAYVAVVVLHYDGVKALAAVALAFTISRSLKVIILILVARRFLPCFPLRETLGFFLRVLIVALGTGCAAWITRSYYESIVLVSEAVRTRDVLLKAGLDLLLSGLVGTAVGLILMRFLCREELGEILTWLRRKLQGARG